MARMLENKVSWFLTDLSALGTSGNLFLCPFACISISGPLFRQAICPHMHCDIFNLSEFDAETNLLSVYFLHR
jgi:hypothetical protein